MEGYVQNGRGGVDPGLALGSLVYGCDYWGEARKGGLSI